MVDSEFFAPDALRTLAGGSTLRYLHNSGAEALPQLDSLKHISDRQQRSQLSKFFQIVSLQRIENRQECPEASQQRRCRRLAGSDLSATQAKQQLSEARHLLIVAALDLPDHDTGHGRDK